MPLVDITIVAVLTRLFWNRPIGIAGFYSKVAIFIEPFSLVFPGVLKLLGISLEPVPAARVSLYRRISVE